ncbi:MAG: SecA domain protein [Verrucomicrobiales bacterium]|nr:SecA domain protein [Verrucomicrobiales bacterium]
MTATPSQEYRRVHHETATTLHKGLDARVNSFVGRYHRRAKVLQELQAEAERIDSQAKRWSEMSDQQLSEHLREFRMQFRRGGKEAKQSIGEALAAIREVSDRKVGLRPFPTQLAGALALHRGFLAEMATGEGKTLVAGLAAVLAGWTRRPCHIITVNDYLVRRDEEWIKPIYQFCGVSVGYVTGDMKPAERRKEYGFDVTYTTSKEALADFLRDRLQMGAMVNPTRQLLRTMLSPQNSVTDGLVMRGLDTAIVDEADSILIDEAVTPLIISAPRQNEELREASVIANEIVSELEPGIDYESDTRYRETRLTTAGIEKLQKRCESYSGLWRGQDRRIDLIRQALMAREFFVNGKQYVLQNGRVVIVDEFTGRPMPQRSWRQGLHQAVEAKEGLTLTDPAETIARLSFQRYFRLYRRLSGMTGTAREASEEFWQIYKLPVVRIPTNKPCIRQQWPDQIFADEATKFEVIAQDVERLHQTGRPILIGTRNVTTSERVASLLDQRGLSYHLLNATRLQEEANIIARAGEKNQITIATNMAGRGTDIKLGTGMAEIGGLHVIATERHESGRVDRQLFGRSGRQGDPGSAQAFVSLEDELLRRYLNSILLKQTAAMLRGHFPAWQAATKTAFGIAQRNAQQIAYKQRTAVLKMDSWLDEALSFAGAPIA